MKKYIVLILLGTIWFSLTTYASNCKACASINARQVNGYADTNYLANQNESDIDLLIGRWKAVYVVVDGSNEQENVANENRYYTFYRDGRYHYEYSNSSEWGKWYISSDRYMSFDDTPDDILSIHIEMLSEKKMVWKFIFTDDRRGTFTIFMTFTKE